MTSQQASQACSLTTSLGQPPSLLPKNLPVPTLRIPALPLPWKRWLTTRAWSPRVAEPGELPAGGQGAAMFLRAIGYLSFTVGSGEGCRAESQALRLNSTAGGGACCGAWEPAYGQAGVPWAGFLACVA